MPWTAHYVSDGVYTAFSGHTTGDELLAAVKDFFAHSYASKPRFALFDFTDVREFDVEAIDVERIVTEDRRWEGSLRYVAIAVVATEAVQYGLARMWQRRLEPTPWRTAVVATLPEALRWLAGQGVDVDRLAVLDGP